MGFNPQNMLGDQFVWSSIIYSIFFLNSIFD